jgi:hypothetical protein
MNRKRIDSYLKYYDDLQEKCVTHTPFPGTALTGRSRIPRSEVESILAFVELQLNRIKPGFKTLLCGG